MLSLEQFLLIKIAEEAGEVAKEALKCAQFGEQGIIKDGEQIKPYERLRNEMQDLFSVLIIAGEADEDLECLPDPDHVGKKLKRLITYSKMSQYNEQVDPAVSSQLEDLGRMLAIGTEEAPLDG
jgi:NTP pyrophosphatase (non-canonical NTP hydrolase)